MGEGWGGSWSFREGSTEEVTFGLDRKGCGGDGVAQPELQVLLSCPEAKEGGGGRHECLDDNVPNTSLAKVVPKIRMNVALSSPKICLL